MWWAIGILLFILVMEISSNYYSNKVSPDMIYNQRMSALAHEQERLADGLLRNYKSTKGKGIGTLINGKLTLIEQIEQGKRA